MINEEYSFVKRSLDKTKEWKGSIIESILDMGSYYSVAYSPEKPPKGAYYEDSFCSVDKNTGKVKAFNPLMDMKKFTEANKSPVYVKSKDMTNPDTVEKGKELVHSMLM